jgi:hypothetical protein
LDSSVSLTSWYAELLLSWIVVLVKETSLFKVVISRLQMTNSSYVTVVCFCYPVSFSFQVWSSYCVVIYSCYSGMKLYEQKIQGHR